jgi:hypothetical protein
MIGLLLSLSMAMADPGWRLERVEILSEDPGSWLHYELPMARYRPSTAALRFVEQVQPVWQTPWEGIVLGTSLSIQTLQIEQALGETGLSWSAGVQTKLLCPRGLVGALHWERNRLHLAAGISASSMASWQNPSWSVWQVLPTAGIGLMR